MAAVAQSWQVPESGSISSKATQATNQTVWYLNHYCFPIPLTIDLIFPGKLLVMLNFKNTHVLLKSRFLVRGVLITSQTAPHSYIRGYEVYC